MKNTPAPNFAAVPVKQDSSSINFNTVSPAFIDVFPYTNVSLTIKFSPLSGNNASLSGPEFKYFTKMVNCSIWSLSSGYK